MRSVNLGKAQQTSRAWKYFIGSCILAAGLLIKAGVPVFPIAVGIAAAAFLTWKRLASRT